MGQGRKLEMMTFHLFYLLACIEVGGKEVFKKLAKEMLEFGFISCISFLSIKDGKLAVYRIRELLDYEIPESGVCTYIPCYTDGVR